MTLLPGPAQPKSHEGGMKRRNDMAAKKAKNAAHAVPEGLRVVKVGVFSVYLKK